MDLRLAIYEKKETGIFGRLYKPDGTMLCHVLMHSYNLQPKLSNGVYVCQRGEHMLHNGPITTFEITGVKGHSGILFHRGNTQEDSDGCLLLGLDRVGDSLERSMTAFNEFMVCQNGEDSFTLTVEDFNVAT